MFTNGGNGGKFVVNIV